MSNLRRQQDELESLKSIYADILTDKTSTTKVWNQDASPRFQIALLSHETADRPVVGVTLDIQFTQTYPSLAPIVTVAESQNLLRAHLERVRQTIANVLQASQGEEVCFTLIMDVKELLDEFQLTTEPVLLLEEERRKRLAAERRRLEQHDSETLRQEKLATMRRSREANEQIREMSDSGGHDARRKAGTDTEDVLVPPRDAGAPCFVFDNVLWGDLPGTSAGFQFRAVVGFVRWRAPDLLDAAGRQYVVRPYVAHSSPAAAQALSLAYFLTVVQFDEKHWETRDARPEILQLETQLEAAVALPALTALLKVYGFQIDHHAGPPGRWTVRVLTELPPAQNLDSVLQTAGPVDWRLARAWLIQVLPALELLHNHGLTHRLLCPLAVLVCEPDVRLEPGQERALDRHIKLCHASYGHTLVHMAQRHDPVVADRYIPRRWHDPDPQGDLFQTDIWELGVLFMRIMLGYRVLNDAYATPAVFFARFDPRGYAGAKESAECVFDLLSRMLQLRAARRPSALELNTVRFLRADVSGVQAAPVPATVSALSLSLLGLSELPALGDNMPGSNARAVRNESRYTREVEEVGKLGRGAFGEVVKVRNRMDGAFYAVKKIKHRQEKLETLLSEVLSLARLNHQYIVRYYGCWVEEVHEGSDAVQGSDDSASDFSDHEFDLLNMRLTSIHRTDGFQVDYIGNSVALVYSYDDGIVFASDSNDKVEEDLNGESGSHESTSEEDSNSNSNSNSNNRLVFSQLAARSEHKAPGRQKTCILYIQMEFCENNTLSDLIDRGLPSNRSECWRLFRELLEAVSYIHSCGFIHRDLKPTNVFIDESNHIKVGDFGLAKKSRFLSALLADNQVARRAGLSTKVGTFFYTAKEVASGAYDEKVDMYSLGIIFFEMCYPLGTGMERAAVLNRLRLAEVQFPSDFGAAKATERHIIASLLRHDPRTRPGAAQLLQGGLLPVEHQDAIVKDVLRLLADPALPWQQQVRDALFGQPYLLARDIMFDRAEKQARGDHTADYLMLERTVAEAARVFRSHGAVPDFGGSAVVPRTPMRLAGGAYELLDRSGAVLTLQYDLVLRVARQVSREQVAVAKMFAHDFVYRPNWRGAGKPDKYSAMVFGVFSDDRRSAASEAAECLKAADEVVARFACLAAPGSQTCFVVNHADILASVVEYVFGPVSERRRHDILAVLSQLVERGATDTRAFLRTDFKVQHTVLAHLFDLFDFCVDPARGIAKLRKAMVDLPLLARVERAAAELHEILAVARLLGVRTPLSFSPLSNYNARYYAGGFMFQLIHRADRTRPFCRVASGGRFDTLVDHLASEGLTLPRTPHAAGFQLNTTLLFLFTKAERAGARGISRPVPRSDRWRPVRCDVLVYVADDAVLADHGYALVAALWAHEVVADWGVFSLHEQLLRRAAADGCNWLVQLRPAPRPARLHNSLYRPVRVKDVDAGRDIDLEYGEVVAHVCAAIATRGADVAAATLLRSIEHRADKTDSGADVGATSDKPDPVAVELAPRVVVVPHAAPRGRKNNRRGDVEDAARRGVGHAVGALARAAVISVDLTDAVLDMMLATSLQVLQEEWLKRAFATNNKLARTFAVSVHDALTKEALRGARWALLHSPRTDKTCIVDLQR
ncbi:Serine/threonine-protein kinase [Metschnikowia bicuspidata]|uniref:non-specific serine/threonine protein kinase n=1 Tax=Metschnikowia bicuspidata TaxID=27322 RepID=A0A4P9ZFB5_9ASCO|nr:Serine/threonine-protein kinase [Metschnikowia bicuspidata]